MISQYRTAASNLSSLHMNAFEAPSSASWSSGKEENARNLLSNSFVASVFGAYADSVFSLQPPGDSLRRRGFYDSWMHGCIPVVTRESADHVLVAAYKRLVLKVHLDKGRSNEDFQKLHEAKEK